MVGDCARVIAGPIDALYIHFAFVAYLFAYLVVFSHLSRPMSNIGHAEHTHRAGRDKKGISVRWIGWVATNYSESVQRALPSRPLEQE